MHASPGPRVQAAWGARCLPAETATAWRTPTAAALRAQPALTTLSAFDELLAPMRARYGADYNGEAWGKCLKMVRNNKCTAVC